MNPLVSAYVVTMVIAAMLCMVIIVYVWPQRRKNSETLPLILLLVGITEWICAALLGMLDQNLLHKLLWAKIEYIGVLSVPLAVLVFVLFHSGTHSWLTSQRLAWLALIPLITLVLAWTNEYHRLVWASYVPYLQDGLAFSQKTYGTVFWIYWGYSYLLLLVATFLTIRSMLASARIFRWQSLLVAVGILAPWAANLLYILHIHPVRNLDLTPLAFGITGLALAAGMFRWQLFDIKPIAQAAVITGLADGLIILDSQGRILEVNPAAQAILGLAAPELVGKPMDEMIASRLAPDERSRWIEEKGLEIRLPVNGENRDYELSDSPFYERGGPLGGRVILMHDVTGRMRLEGPARETERKQTGDKLYEDEQRLASIYDTVEDVIYYLAVEPQQQYRFISVNPAFGKVTGLPPGQVIGRKVNEIIPEPSLGLVLGKYRQAIEEKTTLRWEETSDYPSGRLTGEVSIAPVFDENGNCTHLIGTVHDITGRAQVEQALRVSEDKFKYVFDYSVDGKSITLPSGEISVNRAFCDLLGYSPEQLQSRKWQEITHPDDIALTQREIDTLLSGEKEAVRFTKRYIKKDGSIVWADIGTSLRRDQVGQPLYFMTSIIDITERKQAEEALRESEARYHLITEYVEDIVWQLDTVLRFTYVSPAVEQVLGYSTRETQGLRVTDLLDENGIALMQQVTKDRLEQKTDLGKPTEYKMKHKNGNWVDVEVLSSPVYDADGHPVGFVGITRDITERKQAEEKLRESEARYRLIFEYSGTANTIFDTECRVILQNSQSQKLTMPANALGKTALEIFGPGQGQIVTERMQRALALGVAEVFETRFNMPLGEKWIRSSYLPLFNEQQGVVGIQVISQDISAQKQAEELLRETSERLVHMLANSPTVIYALKVQGDLATPTWISENIEAVLGFGAGMALQPDWWPAQVFPEDRSEAVASLAHLFDDFYEHEYRFLRKDGSIIWLHDEHRLLRSADNSPREIIGAWTDITERRQAEQALREYNVRLALDVVERTRELQEAQEKLLRQEKLAVLGQLAGGVGHELRNPLAVINNAVYYLKLVQPDADEKIRKYHGVIEHELHNAEKIISDLLDFARIKAVDRQPVAVPDLLRAVLERFPAPESIATALEFPADLPQVFVDPRQLEQVLGNLVVNACQAMPNGGRLTIHARPPAPGVAQPEVCIRVEDTGTGITPENMPKLFEPLFTTKPRGIGLGLAVSKKLVEANRGRIQVLSEPGKGTTFMLYLPVNSPDLPGS
jgi:PAS domain S-box-containing protein